MLRKIVPLLYYITGKSANKSVPKAPATCVNRGENPQMCSCCIHCHEPARARVIRGLDDDIVQNIGSEKVLLEVYLLHTMVAVV